MKLPKKLFSLVGARPIHLAVTIYSSTGYNECSDKKGFWTTNKKYVTCKKCLSKYKKPRA